MSFLLAMRVNDALWEKVGQVHQHQSGNCRGFWRKSQYLSSPFSHTLVRSVSRKTEKVLFLTIPPFWGLTLLLSFPLQKFYPTNQCITIRATVRKQYVTATTVIHDVGILKQKQEEKDESEKITNFGGGWTTSNYSQSKNLDFLRCHWNR